MKDTGFEDDGEGARPGVFRLRWDPTLNYGHLATGAGLIVTVAIAWAQMEAQIEAMRVSTAAEIKAIREVVDAQARILRGEIELTKARMERETDANKARIESVGVRLAGMDTRFAARFDKTDERIDRVIELLEKARRE